MSIFRRFFLQFRLLLGFSGSNREDYAYRMKYDSLSPIEEDGYRRMMASDKETP